MYQDLVLELIDIYTHDPKKAICVNACKKIIVEGLTMHFEKEKKEKIKEANERMNETIHDEFDKYREQLHEQFNEWREPVKKTFKSKYI